jgi:hypothetical protein
MADVKTFRIEQKFSEVDELYAFLAKNLKMLNELTGLQVQKPKYKGYCLTAKEVITERNIIFFASKSEFPESLGELMVLAAAYSADIVIFFMPKASRTYLESVNWLQSICNHDTLFLVGEAMV